MILKDLSGFDKAYVMGLEIVGSLLILPIETFRSHLRGGLLNLGRGGHLPWTALERVPLRVILQPPANQLDGAFFLNADLLLMVAELTLGGVDALGSSQWEGLGRGGRSLMPSGDDAEENAGDGQHGEGDLDGDGGAAEPGAGGTRDPDAAGSRGLVRPEEAEEGDRTWQDDEEGEQKEVTGVELDGDVEAEVVEKNACDHTKAVKSAPKRAVRRKRSSSPARSSAPPQMDS